MTTYYVDYEGSAGTGDGSSFANRANKVSNVTITGTNSKLEPGDVIRVKKTPDPTVLGTGTVDHSPSYRNWNSFQGSYANCVFSTTTGQTLIQIPRGMRTGDRVLIYDSNTAPSSVKPEGKNIAGIWQITIDTTNNGKAYLDGFTASNTDSESGTYRIRSHQAESVKISGTQPWKVLSNLRGGRSAWTAVGGGSNASANYKVGWSEWTSSNADWLHPAGTDHMQIPGTSSTGLKCYIALDSTADLSAYQQISMLVRFGAGTETQTAYSLRLCTDNAGATSVHTIPLTRNKYYMYGWHPVVVDLGTNLNSGINSLAIYQDEATSTQGELYIHNICACKASSDATSVTHNSLIGLNTADDPVWYPVDFLCDNGVISLCNYARGYQAIFRGSYYANNGCYFSLSSTNATIYKREPIIPKWIEDNLNIISSGTYFENLGSTFSSYDTTNTPYTVADSGGIISCGWDTTNMSTQEGHTFIRGNGLMTMVYSGNNNVTIERLHGTSFYKGFSLNSAGCYLKDVGTSDMWHGNAFHGMHYMRACDFKYAIGCQSNSSSYANFYFYGSSSTQTNQHPSASYTDFNIGYANGAANQNSYAVKFWTTYNMHWNKINCLWTGRQVDMGQNVQGNTFEEIRAGGAHQSYGCKFEDSGNKSAINNTIKKLIAEGPSNQGFVVSNAGPGNVIEEIDCRNAERMGWGVPNYGGGNLGSGTWRNEGSWENARAVVINTGHSLRINGGQIDSYITLYNNSELRSVGLEIIGNQLGATIYSGAKWLAKDFDGVSGVIKNYYGSSTKEILPETTTRHTASGYAWKFNGNWNEIIELEAMKVIVNSGSLVTIKVWAYREDTLYASSGQGLHGQLIVSPNPDIGLNSTLTADIPTGSSNNQVWRELSCTFTPTAAGIVTVSLKRFSDLGSTDGYVIFDDFSVSQA
jgi:hypothetical protein